MPFKVVKKKPTPPKVVRASKKTLTKKAPKAKKPKGRSLASQGGKNMDVLQRRSTAKRRAAANARRKKK